MGEWFDTFPDSRFSTGSSTCRVSWARLSSLVQLFSYSDFTGSLTCEVGDVSASSLLWLTTRVAASISAFGLLKIGRITIGTTGSHIGSSSKRRSRFCSNWFNCPRLILFLWTKGEDSVYPREA